MTAFATAPLPRLPLTVRAAPVDPLVLVLLAWALAEPVALGVARPGAEVAFGVAAAAPLLARHRRPAVAAGGTLAAVLAQHALGLGAEPLHATTAAALVAGHASGALAVRSATAGAGLAAAALLVAQALGALATGGWAEGGTQLTFTGVLLGGVAIGFFPRHRAARAAALRAEVAALELELATELRAAAAHERALIAGELERLVARVTAAALPPSEAAAPGDAALALRRTERAARRASEELRALLRVLDAPEPAGAALARSASRPVLASMLARLARLHAAYGPVMVFASIGVVEQLLLPARPHALDSGAVVAAAPYPGAVAVILAAATALPLLLRDRAPLVAIGAAGALLTARAVAGDLSSLTWSQNAVGVALAFVAGAFATRRADAALGLALAGAATAATWALEQSAVSPFEWLYLAALLAGACLAGRHMRPHVAAAAHGEGELAALRARRLRLAAEAAVLERRRVAREVHDLVGHGLSLMTMHASMAAVRLQQGAEPVDEAVRRVRALAAETERELAALLATLRGPRGTTAAAGLGELVASVRRHGQPVELAGDVDGELPAVLVEVVREALTNARKHAGAVPVQVHVRAGAEAAEAEVVHGPGTALLGPGSGRGLAGLHERVAAAGGVLDAGPLPDGGWRVRCRLPGGAR